MLKKLFVFLVSFAFVLGTTALAPAQTQQPQTPPPVEKPAAKPAEKPAAKKPKAKSATGTVKTVSPDSLVVEAGKKELTFAISGEPADAAKALKAGDRVTVTYTEADGKMTATKVTAKAATAAKKASEPAGSKTTTTPPPAQKQ